MFHGLVLFLVVPLSSIVTLLALHEKQTFKCNSCEKAFRYKSNIYSHMKTVHEMQKNHKCECGREFTNSNNLKNHKKLVHEKQSKIYKCNSCETSFKLKNYLKEHIKNVHEKVKNFKCDICDKSFVSGSL